VALTRLQQTAQRLGEIGRLDFWNAEYWETEHRIPLLRLAIAGIVRSEVVTEYTVIDDILATILCREYFKNSKQRRFIFWNQKRFRVFVQYLLDEIYLLKKLDAVHALQPLPKEVREIVRKLNAVRNALAHSFFPENRKEYTKVRKLVWNAKDIHSADGFQEFRNDCHRAFVYLAVRAHGTWYDDWDLPPITN
jgi:hypothetical protein